MAGAQARFIAARASAVITVAAFVIFGVVIVGSGGRALSASGSQGGVDGRVPADSVAPPPAANGGPHTPAVAVPEPVEEWPTCGPISFPTGEDHGTVPLDGPVATCIRPEIDPGPDPIHKEPVPLP